ncbi:MAG: MIP family channel protein [Chloroflexi bacterium]|nr:MIP family channel protein [Chloroflexota bacterium]MDA1271862.1 MIP family channel protein [Chloroflexota bacterium]
MRRKMVQSSETWRECTAEFIATLFFVFLGAGTVVATGLLGDGTMTTNRLIAIALAHGLAITLLVSATASVSGGHINPVVTLAALVTRKITPTKGVLYLGSQITGGIGGAALIAAVVPEAGQGALGSHRLGVGVTVWSGLLAEAALTFVLIFVVFATAMDPKGPKLIAPGAIGLAVLVDHLLGVPLTGASMNPARSFGPALMSWTWDAHWIYWIGPIAGGLSAAIIYHLVFVPRTKEPVEDRRSAILISDWTGRGRDG